MSDILREALDRRGAERSLVDLFKDPPCRRSFVEKYIDRAMEELKIPSAPDLKARSALVIAPPPPKHLAIGVPDRRRAGRCTHRMIDDDDERPARLHDPSDLGKEH